MTNYVALSLTNEGGILYKYFFNDVGLLGCYNRWEILLKVCDGEGYHENDLERALSLDKKRWQTRSVTDPKEINRILMMEELLK